VSAATNGVGPIGQIVAKRLRELRQARGLSKQALAEATRLEGRHIHAVGIGRIEEGSRRVDVDDLSVLARALDVSIFKIIEGQRCHACFGAPPVGFTCNSCGAEAR
jgi:transcriptional regulator with XRE-family HTH domain